MIKYDVLYAFIVFPFKYSNLTDTFLLITGYSQFGAFSVRLSYTGQRKLENDFLRWAFSLIGCCFCNVYFT